MTYADWARHHCRLYCLTPEQVVTVAAWLPELERQGWTPDELDAASCWLLVNAPPKWFPQDHLTGLRDRIAAARREAHYAALARLGGDRPDGERGECVRCGNSGRLIVPHPARVRAGSWVPERTQQGHAWYTAAVRCSCWDGQRFSATVGVWDGDRRRLVPHLMLDLQDYEAINPGWRQQMTRLEEMTRQAGDEPPAERVRRLDELAVSILRHVRMPGEDDREPDGGAGEWREGGAGW